MSRGYSLYKKKRFDQAADAFEGQGSKGRSLAKYVARVEAGLKKGDRSVKSKDWSGAVSGYESARKSDDKLNKYHAKELAEKLARAHGYNGKRLLDNKQYRDARSSLKKGMKYGSSPSLTDLERELDKEARRMFIDAKNKQRSDPEAAARLYREIMLMVSSSSKTYKDAKRMLIEL